MNKRILIFTGLLLFSCLFFLRIYEKISSNRILESNQKDEKKYFYRMIEKMAKLPEKKPFLCDAPNEGYASLQGYKPSSKVAEYITQNWDMLQARSLIGHNLLMLLGEIHSSASVPVLLAHYLKYTDYRSAISLSACLNTAQVKNVLEKITDAGLLDRFLKDVLSKEHLEKLKNKNAEECTEYFIGNFDDIKKSSVQRSRPLLG